MTSNLSHLPERPGSFVSCPGKAQREIDRDFYLGAMKLQGCLEKERHGEDAIHEEKEEEDEQTDAHAQEANAEEPDANLATISDDIKNLIAFILRVEDSGESPAIPGFRAVYDIRPKSLRPSLGSWFKSLLA